MAKYELNEELFIEKVFSRVFPIGSIYISVSSVNPSELFGGTWERFGRGRTLVGYTSGETYANQVEKTGGEKTHYHLLPMFGLVKSSSDFGVGVLDTSKFHETTPTSVAQNAGNWYLKPTATNATSGGKQYGTSDGSNFQPYIVVFMWKRIS